MQISDSRDERRKLQMKIAGLAMNIRDREKQEGFGHVHGCQTYARNYRSFATKILKILFSRRRNCFNQLLEKLGSRSKLQAGPEKTPEDTGSKMDIQQQIALNEMERFVWTHDLA